MVVRQILDSNRRSFQAFGGFFSDFFGDRQRRYVTRMEKHPAVVISQFVIAATHGMHQHFGQRQHRGDDFEFAPAAREVMLAFNALRAEHEPRAKKALDEANAAFQQGRRDDGYAKYQEIVDKYYAASSYRNVKQWLAERK